MNKPYETILSEFEGTIKHDETDEGDGDVKYHLGLFQRAQHRRREKSPPAALAEPSHLELVNPCRWASSAPSKTYLNDRERN
jgi:2-oxoglutarate dehydrogenase E1 component